MPRQVREIWSITPTTVAGDAQNRVMPEKPGAEHVVAPMPKH